MHLDFPSGRKPVGFFLWAVFFLLLWLAADGTAGGATPDGIAVDPEVCLGCHGDSVARAGYAASVHAQIACTGCHRELTDLARHLAGQTPSTKVNCVPCHKPEARQHFSSVHMLAGLGCGDCHSAIHRQRPWGGDKRLAVATCLECHDGGGYQESVHGRALAAGNEETAACPDCHQLHQVSQVSGLDTNRRRALHSAELHSPGENPDLRGQIRPCALPKHR